MGEGAGAFDDPRGQFLKRSDVQRNCASGELLSGSSRWRGDRFRVRVDAQVVVEHFGVLGIREQAWALMAQHLDAGLLEGLATEIGLSEAIAYAPRLLAGEVRGRTVVNTAR